MDMNKILDTVMTFINENTNILIGICIFLIFVLIGYLIDNSVKSKRVRKDIKNKDQVPENIKKDIIDEAIDKKEVSALSKDNKENQPSEKQEEPQNLVFNDNVDKEIKEENIKEDIEENNPSEFENFINDNANPLNLDENKQEDLKTNEINNVNNANDNGIVDDINVPLDLDLGMNAQEVNPTENIIPIDIKNEKDDNNEYKNDLSLSEILFDEEKKEEPSPLNIDLDVNTNENVKTEENKTNSIDDELDSIMKKLNSVNNTDNDEEDNYTNIF